MVICQQEALHIFARMYLYTLYILGTPQLCFLTTLLHLHVFVGNEHVYMQRKGIMQIRHLKTFAKVAECLSNQRVSS